MAIGLKQPPVVLVSLVASNGMLLTTLYTEVKSVAVVIVHADLLYLF